MVDRRGVIAVFLFALSVTRTASAEWAAVASEKENAAVPGVFHLSSRLTDNASGETAELHMAMFNAKSATLRVIDQPNESDSDLSEAMQKAGCLAGVNGGYFDPNFQPIGLRVIDGVVRTPLVRARLLSGVLCASARGIEIVRLGEFSRRRKLEAAVESGPFLVDLGGRVPGLDDTRRARRTFAAVARGGTAAVGVSSALTLSQLGSALSAFSAAGDWKIWRAMNLDGGSSTAFWFTPRDRHPFSIREQKSVRDFVGVIAKP